MTVTQDKTRNRESSTEDGSAMDANTADSSGAEPTTDANVGGEDQRENLLSVITDVVSDGESGGESEPAGDSSSPESEAESASEEDDEDAQGEGDGESESGESEAGSDDKTDDQPPFHEHPRWKELVADRDRLKEPAENYQRLTQYMESNSLDPEEVAEGFQIMALMKQDPAQARRVLEQKMQSLQQFDPGYIPPDLQQDVDSGAIAPERAQEMAQLRAQGNNAQFQARQAQQRTEQERQQAQATQRHQHGQMLAGAVNQWEERLKTKDADYAQKAPWVRDRLRALMQEQGKPQDSDAAVKMADQAYKDVNKRLSQFSGKPKRSVKPTPSGGSSNVNKEPTSLDEAIDQALGG